MNRIINTREMKIFKEKECMTETTKFNFMKHLPTPQPNRSRFALVFLLFMTFLLGSMQGWGQVTQTFDYTGSNQTFIVPAGVTSVIVECWGGGAAGSNAGIASGGGGGGAYTKGTLTGLTPGNSLTIIVGAGGTVSATQATTDGKNSSVSTIVANGGKTVVNNRNGGAGGAASAITGAVTVSYAGGAGGNGRSSSGGGNNEAGGGGGGSALTTANGSNGGNGGSSTTSVTAGGSGTGAGGGGAAGDGNPDATAGNVPGGGGGGRGEGTSTSKSGAHGRVVITYCTSNVTPSVTISSDAASNTICSGTSVTFTATPTNGGSAPTYQWKLNGTNVGTGGTTYSNSALANNDIVSVVMTANNVCQTASTATSSGITMTINTTPTAPTASNQIVPFGSTIDDLVATGTAIQWFSAASGGSALATTTSLSTTTYYVSQTGNTCESPRTAVAVTVGSAGGSITMSAAGTYSFPIPSFVKGFEVETWGAGGKGGTRTGGNNIALAGGGGGAYSSSMITVPSGTTSYSLAIGAGSTSTSAGGDTWFGSTTTVLAKGGSSVADDSNTAGAGGLASSGYGTTKYSGGNGATGTGGSFGGGGGSSAGTAANGTTTTNVVTGGNAPSGGGNGGNGAISGTGGSDGTIPGGGGGGGFRAGSSSTQAPGDGGNGQIRLTYVDISNLTVASTPITVCQNNTATITLNSTSLANGNYYVYYSTTWNGTSTPQSKVYMTFNSGTTAGTFTTVALANGGNYTITITRIENSSETDIYSEPVNALTKSVTVNPTLTASVSIAASATTICAGTSVTFTATPTNGGTTPSYQWKVNGTNVGTNAATYISTTLANNDIVTCVMTSNATPCLAGSPATSNGVTMVVNPIVTPTFTQVSAICSGASLSALPTTSNNSITGTWSPSLNNTATTTYTFTPTAGQCALTTTMTITVTPTINYYADADGDGYGNASSTQATCSQPEGYVSNNSDCNDNSSSVNPGASELCNNSDDNCNSQIDEGASNSVSTFITACATYTWSVNNTTYTTSGNYTSGTGCNTQVLHLTITAPALTYYIDADQDGFGAGTGSLFCTNPGAGYSTANTDCNDANVSISPMAEELCDGIDNDCNASTTDGLGTTSYFIDADGDTYGNPNITVVSCSAPAGYVSDNTDCDDSNAALYIINTYFSDSDEDSFGDAEAPHEACFLTAGYVMNAQDCDDANAAVNQNATEICNQIDDDCDGLVNDGLTSVDYHFDGDGDGYGSGVAVLSCAPITNYVQNSADCNDSDAAINPNATEICGNTVDEDCNAGDLIPSYYTSRQSGAWTSASTWNKSCDNTTYDLALSAPQGNYAGIVTIASSHAVTVGTIDAYIASAGNLNINATGSLTINGKMSVSQTLVNNGTLTVNNGASFLQSSQTGVNTGNGAYVVNLNLTGTSANGTAPNGRYWYLGSPMNNTNIYNTFYNPSTMTRVWDYLPATNAWSPIIISSTGVGVNSATNMAVGIGYLYRAGSAQSVTYNGTSSTFNNNVTTPLSFSGIGYKYVANPYTSHLDWKLLTRTGLNVSYWIRNAMNTSYESYNATSGISTNNGSGQTTQFIPPMQGFWIYAYTTPCSLRMDNGDRVHSTNTLHSVEQNQIVRLNLNDGKTDDQAVVYENENASNGIEEYDTDKFMDENHHQVYFLEGTKQVSLDGLKDATAKQKVDMGIQITGAGTYTINAVELGVEEDVMLEDKFTHTFQDMKRNSSYSFTANAGTFNNRFVLHFTLNPQTETSMESVAVTEEVTEVEGVQVYTTTGQQVKVWVTNNTDFQNAAVKVYDAIGNMIERKNMTSNELLLDLDTATGVYLVELTGANKTFTKKVFISK